LRGRGQEKSLSTCLALTWCRLPVESFLPGGRHGSPLSILLYKLGETLGPVKSRHQRHVFSVSLLEGDA
jgi:hypothetical protein